MNFRNCPECGNTIQDVVSANQHALVELQWFSEAVRQCTEVIVLADTSLRIQYTNPAFEQLFGYSLSEVRGRELSLLLPDDPGLMAANTIEPGFFKGEKLRRAKDGRNIPVLLNIAQVKDQSGVVIGLIGTMTDLSEIKTADSRLRLAASVFEHTQEGVCITDPAERIIDVNSAFCNITGYAREEVLGQTPRLLGSGRQAREFYVTLWQAIARDGWWQGELVNRRRNGDLYTERLTISAVRDEHNAITHYVGVLSDITSLKAQQEQLEKLAHYDALTGIPNRVLLFDRMRQAISQTQRSGSMLAVCYLDLDGFKPVNDTHGHEAGDKLLVEISTRLLSCLRGGDTVARLGGDEFVLLLLGLEHVEECQLALRRILELVSQPMVIADAHAVSLSASIGVSLYPQDDTDADTLLGHADQAMYRAKQQGKNRYHMFNPGTEQLGGGQGG